MIARKNQRWVKYLMKMECKICHAALYPDEDSAELELESILEWWEIDSPDDLRDALSWNENQGFWCDYHTYVLNKDD